MKKIKSIPRMFEEVSKQIIAYIQDENIQIGEKLPTERKLSELLEVSRSSIREGLRILELLQFIESRQGDGTFVSSPPPFMIPKDMIEQEIDQNSLTKYFEIAILHAEQIITASLNQGVPISKTEPQLNFWDEFNLLMNDLGSKIENNYHLTLWNSIFTMLKEHQYFKEMKPETSITKLKTAYKEQNKALFLEFFKKHEHGHEHGDGSPAS